jgi:hypothetical protein
VYDYLLERTANMTRAFLLTALASPVPNALTVQCRIGWNSLPIRDRFI